MGTVLQSQYVHTPGTDLLIAGGTLELTHFLPPTTLPSSPFRPFTRPAVTIPPCWCGGPHLRSLPFRVFLFYSINALAPHTEASVTAET